MTEPQSTDAPTIQLDAKTIVRAAAIRKPRRPRSLGPMALGILGLGLVVAWTFGMKWNFKLDDCFISLRYAENLWLGYGPVYNPGERPVEGYTNFLWMVLAAVHYAFTEFPEHWLLLYNRLFGLGIVAVVWWEATRREGLRRRWVWLATMLAAGHETLHVWMTGGLETNFFVFLIALSLGRFLREEFHPETTRGYWSALPMGLALLTRPEAYMLGGIMGFAMIVRRLIPGNRAPGGWQRVLWWGGICAVIGVPHLLWRYSYYGMWVPNTFVAKVPGAYFKFGVPYVEIYTRFMYGHWTMLACCGLVALAAACFDRRRRESGELAILATMAAAMFAYLMYVGGDVFEFRLLAPTIPILAWLIPMSFDVLRDWSGRLWGGRALLSVSRALVFVGAAILTVMLGSAMRVPYWKEMGELMIAVSNSFQGWDFGERWRPAGEWLRQFARPNERMAITGAGVVPYVARLSTLDIHGLNDDRVARIPVTTRGGIGHERRAPDDFIAKDGVTYYVHDVVFKRDHAEWPRFVFEQDQYVMVQLLNGEWMIFRTFKDPNALRRSLRERGAIVLPGPKEDRVAVEAINKRNQPRFNELIKRAQEEKNRRMEKQFFRQP